MAIYHTSLRVVTRSKGESAVAAAAYRAGIALHDDRLGLTQDYSRRKGVALVEVLTPAGTPAWAADSSALWNAAEPPRLSRSLHHLRGWSDEAEKISG